jgi:hypothetical protein
MATQPKCQQDTIPDMLRYDVPLFGRRERILLSQALHPDRHPRVSAPAIDGMITALEVRAYASFAKYIWDYDVPTNGVIVDGGCYTGASTVCFAEGLRQSNLPQRKRRERIWSYDLFRATPAIAQHYLQGSGLTAGDSFRPIFEANVAQYAEYIKVHEGDIRRAPVPPQPIAILFLDVLWSWDTTISVGRNFYPKLQPGRSILIQQDFSYPFYPWVILSMGQLSDFFNFGFAVQHSSVIFDVAQKLRERDIQDPRDLPLPKALHIYDSFIDRSEGWRKGSIGLGKALYLASLNRVDEARRLIEQIAFQFSEDGEVTQDLDSVRGYCDRVASHGRPIALEEVVGI